MADATITYPSGGSLQFTASTDLLTAAGAASVSFDNTGGDVELDAVKAASITASGKITASASVNVTGGDLTLTAGAGIGVPGSPIQTNVSSLDATTTSGDIIVVQGSNPFTVNATSKGYSDPSTQTGSDINVKAATGNMTVGAVSALGSVALDAGGAILVGAGNPSNVSANALSLTAANGIGASAGALN